MRSGDGLRQWSAEYAECPDVVSQHDSQDDSQEQALTAPAGQAVDTASRLARGLRLQLGQGGLTATPP